MNDNLQTQFKTEGQKAFDVEKKENDNSSESSTDQTNDNQTQSQDGEQKSSAKKDDIDNFADHPRWKEREDDWKKRFNEQEKRHTDEIAKLREEFQGLTKSQKDDVKHSSEVPAWFGGDDQQWTEFQKWNNSLVTKAEEAAINKILSQSREEQKRIDDATAYFNEQISTIENDKSINPQGDKIDKNKLLKFVLDNDLVDSQGQWNYKAGFLMMKSSVSQPKNDSLAEKKKIAGATSSENRAETKQPNYMTSADFSKPGARPW